MWASRPVFVSSTFQDMQAERDHLRAVVFPAIEERLRARGRYLEWVDLRIGVTDATLPDEGARELQVLKVCLDEVRRCRPFLIVLLGDRYGWVPPEARAIAAAAEAGFTGSIAGLSVTELEIELGVLQNADQQTRSLFYFREPLPYASMPEGVRARYADADGGAAQPFGRRAASLKARIEHALPDRVRRYRAEWDDARGRVAGLDAWGQQVAGDVWAEIEAELAAAGGAVAPGPFEEDRAALTQFLGESARDFVGREALLAEVTQHAFGAAAASAPWGLCLTGAPGSGKSAFVAELARRLSATGALILVHAAGAGARAGAADLMLLRWIHQLADFLGAEPAVTEQSPVADIDRTFNDLLTRAAMQKRVVLLVDALDRFETGARGQFGAWIPASWPANARLVATAVPGEAASALSERAGVAAETMPPLDRVEARAIVNAVSARYHRTFAADVLDALLDKAGPDGPAWTSPLWLVLAAEALNLVDADDLASAFASAAGSPAEQLHAMLVSRARGFAPDIPGIYASTFNDAEALFGEPLVDTFLLAIAASRGGWRQSDFAGILPRVTGEPWNELRFTQLRRYFRGQIRQRGTVGQWDFAHSQMQAAVASHPLAGRQSFEALNGHIAAHLRGLPADDRLRAETLWHLLFAHDFPGAAHYYSGVLTAAELEGATGALIELALIAPTAEHDGGLTYIRSMLDINMDAPEDAEFAAERVMYFVFDRLRVRAPLETLVRLGAKLIACFDSLKLFFPIDQVGPHLAAAYDRVADVNFERRKYKESEHFAEKSEEIMRALVAQQPDNVDWQRDLAIGFNKRGKRQDAAGDADAALQSFNAGLDAITRLVERRPDDPVLRRDLGISLSLVAGAERRRGHFDAAAAVEARRASPADDFDRMVSESDAVRLLIAQKAWHEAAARQRAALPTMERLFTADPGDVQKRHSMVAGYFLLGVALDELGNSDEAETMFRNALRVSEPLRARDPEHAGWQSDAVKAHLYLVRIAQRRMLAAPGNAALRDALEAAFTAMVPALERWLSLEPARSDAWNQLTAAYESLKQIRAEQGDFAGAQEWHTKLVHAEKRRP
jgi:tetratricopeptide (TPR) repeat protein